MGRAGGRYRPETQGPTTGMSSGTRPRSKTGRAGGKHRPETRGPTTRMGTETSPGSQAREEIGVVEKLLSRGERIVNP